MAFLKRSLEGGGSGASPRRSCLLRLSRLHGLSGSVPQGGLQSGVLLEGHSQESGCRLVQEPAQFPSVGLDQGGGERVFLLVLQNALHREGRGMRPGPQPQHPSELPGSL